MYLIGARIARIQQIQFAIVCHHATPASTDPTNNKQNSGNNNNKCNKKEKRREREGEGESERGQVEQSASKEMATAEELIATTKYKIDEAKNIMKNN